MGEKSGNRTNVERVSDEELVVSRVFNGPVHIVYEAWTTPALFQQWWALKSIGVPMIACEMDVRTGGGYRVAYGHDIESAMSFYGTYLEVIPNARLVWTNEEDEEGAVTTVTFEAMGEKTLLVLRETYPSKEAFDEGHGAEEALPEQFAQLDEIIATLLARG